MIEVYIKHIYNFVTLSNMFKFFENIPFDNYQKLKLVVLISCAVVLKLVKVVQ